MFGKCLMVDFEMTQKMVKIGHMHYQLEAQTSIKKSLSSFNDKKWIRNCGAEFKTCSLGHKGLQ